MMQYQYPRALLPKEINCRERRESTRVVRSTSYVVWKSRNGCPGKINTNEKPTFASHGHVVGRMHRRRTLAEYWEAWIPALRYDLISISTQASNLPALIDVGSSPSRSTSRKLKNTDKISLARLRSLSSKPWTRIGKPMSSIEMLLPSSHVDA